MFLGSDVHAHKGMAFCSSISIMNFKLSCQDFNFAGKIVASLMSGLMVRVPCSYRLLKELRSYFSSRFTSIGHINVLAGDGPRGKPIDASFPIVRKAYHLVEKFGLYDCKFELFCTKGFGKF